MGGIAAIGSAGVGQHAQSSAIAREQTLARSKPSIGAALQGKMPRNPRQIMTLRLTMPMLVAQVKFTLSIER
jgi:hypothetical protein